MQYFKGDAEEKRFYNSGLPILETILAQRDLFLAGAYTAFDLGEVIFDNEFAPLANAIERAIYREAYPEIFQAFVAVGTAEAYIDVFKKIFGDDVEVTFTVPAAGRLQIAIVAQNVVEENLVARHITDNVYLFDNVVTQALEQVICQSLKGFKTQYELEQMLFQMVPAGIFTEISLSLGS